MSNKYKSAFFAFPDSPPDLVAPIQVSTAAVKNSDAKIGLQTWPQMAIFGSNIPDVIKSNIGNIDVLICGVTYPNLNVYYEIGYAIGAGKTIAPVVNTSFANAETDIRRDGFFDNIGYEKYENSDQLIEILKNLPSTILAELYSKPINFQQPLFILDTLRKTDLRNAIISSVKNSKVFYRSFDPVEIPRFSTVPIIGEVTASAGIIIPILADHIDDAPRHNLRAAFLSGLGHGLKRQTVLLKLDSRNQVNPTDYRDFVLSIRNEDDVKAVIVDFAKNALLAGQSISPTLKAATRSDLQKLTLGASAAENEFRALGEYFVETSEFVRALRGEVGIVAGRKGSGKTAIFFQVRDNFREEKSATVIDLKPESHQLSLFRVELLKIMDAGSFDHTLAAFWYFVILSEVLLAIKRGFDHRSKFDDRALSAAAEIDRTLAQYGISESGDFTERINRLGPLILQEIRRAKDQREILSPERLTNIIYRDGIGQIRNLIFKHTSYKSIIYFLFDNIDKGWPASGVDPFDARLVRLMTEALDKVRKDCHAQGREFISIVFVRNDIYELLVDQTPDRGKAAEARIDWTDRAKLRQVIYKRLQASVRTQDQSFEFLWARFFTSKIDQRDSFEYFVDHCLMRPRFLINIIENAIANAINRGHHKVEQQDCMDAVRQHSNYLIADFGYEIRDVSGLSEDILYALIGITKHLTREELFERFEQFGVNTDDFPKILNLMIWYGVLGIASNDNQERFIYDYEYNMKRLDAEIRNLRDDVLYIVNPALHVALST